ncbi:hypothetical protein ADIMK_1687 [Marinobacterium lacunae]|uniref:Uncharacterized protein n=1 Tax=Marinobacterium lacunae TaxID=1232683 RepID=A0A081FZJ7_9GAMM|nr:hypothetical protein ADIMK_1687 [Marinobacterium lacunae]
MWLMERLTPDFKTIADFEEITVRVSKKHAYVFRGGGRYRRQ